MNMNIPQEEVVDGSIKLPSKKFSEDTQVIRERLLKELTGNKELIETGDGDSSSGSDDAPSEDNLDIDQIC